MLAPVFNWTVGPILVVDREGRTEEAVRWSDKLLARLETPHLNKLTVVQVHGRFVVGDLGHGGSYSGGHCDDEVSKCRKSSVGYSL